MGHQDEYIKAFDAGYAKAKAKYVDILTDVMFMFENIETARQMPPTAQVVQQYVAMGRLVRKLLKED